MFIKATYRHVRLAAEPAFELQRIEMFGQMILHWIFTSLDRSTNVALNPCGGLFDMIDAHVPL